MDSILEDSWEPEEAAFDRIDIILLAMLWQWLGFVLPSRHPEFGWHHWILRPVTHQRRTSNLVFPCRNILLAFR